jgi:diamine N-acetyltransferase
MKLTGQKVRLRPVEKEDATRMMLWENDPRHWKVSGTEVPYSLHSILDYIEQARHIRVHGQLRLIICIASNDEPIGTLDLYDADFKNLRAAIGILIADSENRGHGYALEALEILEDYARKILGFHNLYCSVHADNPASNALFRGAGYEQVGIRKEWFLDVASEPEHTNGKQWIDEILYQKCLKKD